MICQGQIQILILFSMNIVKPSVPEEVSLTYSNRQNKLWNPWLFHKLLRFALSYLSHDKELSVRICLCVSTYELILKMEKRVLAKVTSQGDQTINSYKVRSWRVVTPHFFTKRLNFALSNPYPLFPYIQFNVHLKCSLSSLTTLSES